MPKQIEINIPVLVGSNGKWNTMGPEPDWGIMADCIMDGNEDPKQVRKYMVRATVTVPDDFEIVVGDATAA